MDDGLFVGMTECPYDSVMELGNDLEDMIEELASHPAIQQQAKILADIANSPIFDLTMTTSLLASTEDAWGMIKEPIQP